MTLPGCGSFDSLRSLNRPEGGSLNKPEGGGSRLHNAVSTRSAVSVWGGWPGADWQGGYGFVVVFVTHRSAGLVVGAFSKTCPFIDGEPVTALSAALA